MAVSPQARATTTNLGRRPTRAARQINRLSGRLLPSEAPSGDRSTFEKGMLPASATRSRSCRLWRDATPVRDAKATKGL